MDGFVEVWDYEAGKLCKDLKVRSHSMSPCFADNNDQRPDRAYHVLCVCVCVCASSNVKCVYPSARPLVCVLAYAQF